MEYKLNDLELTPIELLDSSIYNDIVNKGSYVGNDNVTYEAASIICDSSYIYRQGTGYISIVLYQWAVGDIITLPTGQRFVFNGVENDKSVEVVYYIETGIYNRTFEVNNPIFDRIVDAIGYYNKFANFFYDVCNSNRF